MQFGINMLVPIGMLSALGIWLDGRFHTSFWTILLFFVGAIAGGQNVYRMAKSVYETDVRPADRGASQTTSQPTQAKGETSKREDIEK